MVIDNLINSQNYINLHPKFRLAFEFLKKTDLKSLEEGKHIIDGDNVFAIIAKSLGRTKDSANLEIHRKYIDIQFVVSGTDEMGWKPMAECLFPVDEFDREKDIQFYNDEPDCWIKVKPNCFAIFFPDDAHLPLISDGCVHKIVIKIAV